MHVHVVDVRDAKHETEHEKFDLSQTRHKSSASLIRSARGFPLPVKRLVQEIIFKQRDCLFQSGIMISFICAEPSNDQIKDYRFLFLARRSKSKIGNPQV